MVIKVSVFLAHTCVTSIVNEIQWVCCCLTLQYQNTHRERIEVARKWIWIVMRVLFAFVCVCTMYDFWGDWYVQMLNQARSKYYASIE